MRLLSRDADGDFKLTSFKDDDEVPPYAILSHTWSEGQEVTYAELMTAASASKEKTGYQKLRFCGERAAQDDLQYFWVDTCCIDKQNHVELATAINSMFRWYQRARKCYVYLSDVQVPVGDPQAISSAWADAFRRSRWFTRGWTLQELLAPSSVEFFSKEKRTLGDKISLEQHIHEITQIPIAALRSHQFRGFSVEERMRWVSKRKTTIKEDKAYCLLGIFGVFLPPIPGEGEEYAFNRLRREITSQTDPVGASNSNDVKAPFVSVSSLLPFSRNEYFVGRDSHFKALEQWLYRSNGHRRISVYGLGGSGKTALALEFVYRTIAKHSNYLVFWVPALSRETFELAYRQIGSFLRIPGIQDDNADFKQLFKDGLSSGSFGDWLMIVDNADDINILFTKLSNEPQSNRLIDYLPRSDRGSILFTTRGRKNAESLSKTSVLKLEDMSESKAEARQLLSLQISNKALLEDDHENAIDKLLELLTYLPLAIMQATAFINQNDISISEYVSLFEDGESEAEIFAEHFEDPNRYEEMESTIAKTWYISFNQIRQQDRLAADYLSFMACVDHINIPSLLLPTEGSKLQRMRAIGTLKGYAMITEHQNLQAQDEKFFDVHRLIHIASKWWLEEHGQLSDWNARVFSRLEEVLPYGGHDGRDIWVYYLPHAILMAESSNGLDDSARASLLSRVGECLSTLGQYSTAEPHHRQALELRKAMLGERHPTVLDSMNFLASVLNSQGKYTEAETMQRRTLELRKEVLGELHGSTLGSINNLVSVLYKQGKYEEVKMMHRETLRLRKEVHGERHPRTLGSMNNLAKVLNKQGNYEEAEAIHREALKLRKEVLGERHPNTLVSENNLALVLHNQGKEAEAEAMHRETLKLRKEVLGERHPNTLDSANNLAKVLTSQGKYEEAEVIYLETLRLTTEVLGERHPDTLDVMNNLADLLYNRSRNEEAEAMYRKTLQLRKEVLSERHPDTIKSMSSLVKVLHNRDKHEEAEATRVQMGAMTLKQDEK